MPIIEQVGQDEHRGPEEEFGVKVKAWLSEKDASLDHLVSWLQGYDLPSEAFGVEPYLWLMKALPVDADRGNARVRLAERVAAVVSKKPDVEPCVSRRAGEFLENLLLLSACLKCPDQLCEPLFSLHSRSYGHASASMASPVVRSALRSALALNQLDARLKATWLNMVTGIEQAALVGSPSAGFDGLIYMPESAVKRGQPYWDGIGEGLLGIANHLTAAPDRRPRLRRLIQSALNAYPGVHDADFQLLMQANKRDLPIWAVECLPSLNVSVGDGTNLIWKYILECLPPGEDCYSILERLCRRMVLKVSLCPDAAKQVLQVAPVLEERRLANPWPSERATLGIVVDSFAEMLLTDLSEEAMTQIHAAHQTIFGYAMHSDPLDPPDYGLLERALTTIVATVQVQAETCLRFLRCLLTLAAPTYPDFTDWRDFLQSLSTRERWPAPVARLIEGIG